MLKLRPFKILSDVHFDDRSGTHRDVYAYCLQYDHRRIDQGESAYPRKRIRNDKMIDRIALEKRHENIDSRKQDIQCKSNDKKLPVRSEKREKLRPCFQLKRFVIFLFFISCHSPVPPPFCHHGSSVSHKSACKCRPARSAPDVCQAARSCRLRAP